MKRVQLCGLIFQQHIQTLAIAILNTLSVSSLFMSMTVEYLCNALLVFQVHTTTNTFSVTNYLECHIHVIVRCFNGSHYQSTNQVFFISTCSILFMIIIWQRNLFLSLLLTVGKLSCRNPFQLILIFALLSEQRDLPLILTLIDFDKPKLSQISIDPCS